MYTQTPETVVRIDADKKVAVYYDDDAPNPTQDYGDAISVIDLRDMREDSQLNINAPDALDLRSIIDYTKDPRDAIIKHFRRNGWNACIGQSVPNNYRGLEWVIFAVRNSDYGTPHMIEDMLRDWMDGNVYRLEAQSRHTWRDSHGVILDTWDVTDSLSGVYLDIRSRDELVHEYAATYLEFRPVPYVENYKALASVGE